MRYHKFLLIGLAMVAAALQSCDVTDDDNTSYMPNALVTVKTDDGGRTYFQLDETSTLFPDNITETLFDGKEVRALVSYKELDKETAGYSKTVAVNWIDSIRTKDVVMLQPGESIDAYGHDGIDIVNDWVTVLEDGYLTLRVRTVWGNVGHRHELNLVGNVNADDPLEVELRHDAKGDTYGRLGDALIAFRLKDLAPEAASIQRLTVKWRSMDGVEKKAEVKVPLYTQN